MKASKAQMKAMAMAVRYAFRPGVWDTQFPLVADWEVCQTVVGFFKANDGAQVDTVQVTMGLEGNISYAWQPGARKVDASKATYATLDGSRVDYDGTVVHGTDNSLVRIQSSGENYLVTFYRRVG